MSGTGGAAPPTAILGLDVGGPWDVQKNTHLLSGSVQLQNRSRAPLKLPSLVAPTKGSRRRSSMTRLSLSEPSLLTPSDNDPPEGFSCTRRSGVLQKRPPPPPLLSKSSILLCKNCQPSQSRDQQNRPTFIHFSHTIQPGIRPRPVRRHSHNPALSSEMLHGDLRPSAARRRSSSSSQGEPLSVVGKTCVLSCSLRPAAAAPPARTQLHVFLPSDVKGKEADSESVDEGFMDELDSKITSLKLQQGSPQTVSDHS